MNIGILGSGAGGQALAFELGMKGIAAYITDFPEFFTNLDSIKKNGHILRRTPEGEETTQKTNVLDTVQEVLAVADIIFVVCPAFGTKAFAEACRPHIRKGQMFIIAPDSGGGSIEFKKALGLELFDDSIIVAGTDTLPYAARVLEPGIIRIKLFVDTLEVAALPKSGLPKVLDLLSDIWPNDNLIPVDSVIKLILSDTNPVIHPAVTLLNASAIERTNGDFLFYHEGVTNASADLMEAVDQERIGLGKALGFHLISEPEASAAGGYIDKDKMNFREGYNKSPNFGITKAPPQLEHRYFTEDVGYVLVLWSSLAKLLGVQVPVIDAIIVIVSEILGKDFRAVGVRTAETLGINEGNIRTL